MQRHFVHLHEPWCFHRAIPVHYPRCLYPAADLRLHHHHPPGVTVPATRPAHPCLGPHGASSLSKAQPSAWHVLEVEAGPSPCLAPYQPQPHEQPLPLQESHARSPWCFLLPRCHACGRCQCGLLAAAVGYGSHCLHDPQAHSLCLLGTRPQVPAALLCAREHGPPLHKPRSPAATLGWPASLGHDPRSGGTRASPLSRAGRIHHDPQWHGCSHPGLCHRPSSRRDDPGRAPTDLAVLASALDRGHARDGGYHRNSRRRPLPAALP